MEKNLLLGTGSTPKYKYFCNLMNGTGINCVSPHSLGIDGFEPAEDGATAKENALLKARAWWKKTGMNVLTLDAGLLLLDLPDGHPDQPGVRVRRAPGYTMNDREMMEYYAALAHRHGGKLRAAWQDAYCVKRADGEERTFVFTRRMLTAKAFYLVDVPCGVDVPGWLLNSISVDIASGVYWPLMPKNSGASVEKLGNAKAATDASASIRDLIRRWITQFV